MKRLLNTLYVTTPDAYLSKDGTNVVISSQQKILFRMPIQNIQSIITFGYQGQARDLCVCVLKMAWHCRFSRLPDGLWRECRIRRRAIYFFAIAVSECLGDTDYCRRLASSFVLAKIHNARMTLRRFVRDYPSDEGVSAVADAAESLKNMSRLITRSVSVDEVRGHEGQAASIYFGVMHHLILNKDRCFAFARRVKHPPTDCVNAMLSLGYTLLAHDCGAAPRGSGTGSIYGCAAFCTSGSHVAGIGLDGGIPFVACGSFCHISDQYPSYQGIGFHPRCLGDGAVGSVSLTEDGRKNISQCGRTARKRKSSIPFFKRRCR